MQSKHRSQELPESQFNELIAFLQSGYGEIAATNKTPSPDQASYALNHMALRDHKWRRNGDSGFTAGAVQTIGFLERFRVFQDFRSRPASGNKNGQLESFEGTGTIGVLFALKNHKNPFERKRYVRIQEAFRDFFPDTSFEVVESDSSGNQVSIQFSRLGHEDHAIPINKVGAGIAEFLTLITNLVERKDSVIVVEEPELHLHPHARRQVERLLVEASSRNQVIVVTHDPCFAYPTDPTRVTRVSMRSGRTVTHQLRRDLADRDKLKIDRVLRNYANREILFARSVIVAEDESIERILRGFAETLEIDLDRAGVSIVSAGGHDGFAPFAIALDGLSIPRVFLRDLPWDPKREVKPTHWSFGAELEDYLINSHGFGQLFEEAHRAVGTSKPRAAAWVGSHTPKDRIPPLFGDLLATALQMARP